MRGAPTLLRYRIRNEYFWFSRQPRKQYLLGVKRNKNKKDSGYYSQGVGAAELAKKYALDRRKALCFRWAKRSEEAWLKFFKVEPNWFNSYFFYAMALGYQGRIDEMEKAMNKACRIAGKPKTWKAIRDLRKQIQQAIDALNSG
jgi:hypothetical protein